MADKQHPPVNGDRKIFYERMRRELGVTEDEVKVVLLANFKNWETGKIADYEKVIEEYVEREKLGKIERIRAKVAYAPRLCPVCGKPTQKGVGDFYKCGGVIRHAVLWLTSSVALGPKFLEMRKAWCQEQLKKGEELSETKSSNT